MKDSTTKRETRSRMRNGLCTPPSSPIIKEPTLHDHLQDLLDDLPQDLPTYYHEALLNDLCFLLRSPLFLYAISPRIRRAERTPASSTNASATTRTPASQDLRSRLDHKPATKLNLASLRMEIKRDKKSWATRLLYNTATIIEGREYLTAKDTGFVPSFRFFCEEVAFLGYEFKAREHAAGVLCGTATDNEMVKRGSEGAGEEKRKRRLVKLKVRFRMTRGKPVCTRRMAR